MKKTAGNHYKAGKQSIAGTAKEIAETPRDNALGLGTGEEESAKCFSLSNSSAGDN